MTYVYHASKTQNLKTIEPRISTHGTPWVYAMEKPEYAIMYLGNHSDKINQTGFVWGTPYIQEQYEGSLEYAYKNMSGSIYTLDTNLFKNNVTSFRSEYISEEVASVIKEEKIENALDRILQLEKENKLIIYRFPNKPE